MTTNEEVRQYFRAMRDGGCTNPVGLVRRALTDSGRSMCSLEKKEELPSRAHLAKFRKGEASLGEGYLAELCSLLELHFLPPVVGGTKRLARLVADAQDEAVRRVEWGLRDLVPMAALQLFDEPHRVAAVRFGQRLLVAMRAEVCRELRELRAGERGVAGAKELANDEEPQGDADIVEELAAIAGLLREYGEPEATSAEAADESD